MGVLIECSLFPGTGSRYWIILTAQKAQSVHNLNSRREKIYKDFFFVDFPKALNVYDIELKANGPCLAHKMRTEQTCHSGARSHNIWFSCHLTVRDRCFLSKSFENVCVGCVHKKSVTQEGYKDNIMSV